MHRLELKKSGGARVSGPSHSLGKFTINSMVAAKAGTTLTLTLTLYTPSVTNLSFTSIGASIPANMSGRWPVNCLLK